MKELGMGILTVVGGVIATLAVTFVLSKRVFQFIKELITFSFKAFGAYWYLLLIDTLLFVSAKFYLPVPYSSITIILLCCFIVILPVFYYKKRFTTNIKTLNLQVFGCLTVKDKNYLTVDIDAENLNDKILKEAANLNSRISAFRINDMKLSYIELPKFLPILWGYKGLSQKIQHELSSKKYLASLYFIRDIDQQQIQAYIRYEQANFVSDKFFESAQKAIDSLSSAKIPNLKFIGVSLKLYVSLFSQSILDVALMAQDYPLVQSILTDCNDLLMEVKNEITEEFNTAEFKSFSSLWTSHLERYRAITLIKQKQTLGAIDSIFRSIRANPYFPHLNYEAFKSEHNKHYALQISHSIENVSGIIDESNNTDFSEFRANVTSNLIFANSESTSDILKLALQENTEKRVWDAVYKRLSELDIHNPALLLFKADILKYIPKGEEKFNEVYVDQIDECVQALQMIIEIDPEFSLIYSKIGALLLSKSVHYNDKQIMEECMEYYMKGMRFFSEIGLTDARTTT